MNIEPRETAPTKPRRVIARLSEPEYQAYLGLTQQLSTTRSRLIRKLIRDLIGAGPDLIAHDLKALSQGIFQLGALGRNLNQLVRALNSGQAIASVDLGVVKELKEQVYVLEEEWFELIKRTRKRTVNP